MSIENTGFKEQAEHGGDASGAGPMQLVCEDCGQQYLVGVDSIIVTRDAVMGAVQQHGGQILDPAGRLFSGPNLVLYGGEISAEVRETNLSRVARIRADLQNGVDRSWRCKCQEEGAEPMPFPGSPPLDRSKHLNVSPGEPVVTSGEYKCNVCMAGGMVDLGLAEQIRSNRVEVARGYTGDDLFVQDVRSWALQHLVPAVRGLRGEARAVALQKVLEGKDIVRRLEKGQQFPECPNCGRAGGWTLLRLTHDLIRQYRDYVRTGV